MADSLQYTNYDYASIRASLQARIQARYPGKWNTFLSGDFGTVILDVVAWALTTLAFLVNRMAGEQFIPTMTLRESACRVGALVGYKLHGTTAASLACEVTLQQPQSVDITIYKGTQIRTSDLSSVQFEVAKDYVIPAGSVSPTTKVVTISPLQSGTGILSTTMSATNGSTLITVSDTTLDMTQFIDNGLTFSADGYTTEYTIVSASSNTFTLSTPWTDASATGVTGSIVDHRIQIVQGKTVSETFTTPAGDVMGYSVAINSSGNEPVIDNSVSVTVNGEAWDVIDNLVTAQADSTVCMVETTPLGIVRVTFGDGTFGANVTGSSDVVVSYRIGGGTVGNIALNTISTTIPILVAQTNSPVAILVENNTSSGQGGRDPETLEEARAAIPQYTRTNDRCVTLSDYQAVATGFNSANYGSVAYARASLGSSGFLTGPSVIVYGWTTGNSGGLANLSTPLKLALQDYLQSKAVGTDNVVVYDGTTVPAPISVRYKTQPGYDLTSVGQAINLAINSSITSLYPGDPVVYSGMVSSLNAIPGVSALTVATPTNDLTPANATQLFTVPDPTYVYSLSRVSSGAPVTVTYNNVSYTLSQYSVQLPVFPIQPWSINMTLGGTSLVVLPGLTPGYADVYGGQLSPVPAYRSQINMLTGLMTVWIVGAAGDLAMSVNHIVGYSNDRKVDVYVSAPAVTSQSQRRAIRSVLKQWIANGSVGSTLYATQINGVLASMSNISSVVNTFLGVTAVTRVSLQTANNTAAYVLANQNDLFNFGNIYINNIID